MGDVHNALSLLDREECSTKVETHVGQSIAGRAPRVVRFKWDE